MCCRKMSVFLIPVDRTARLGTPKRNALRARTTARSLDAQITRGKVSRYMGVTNGGFIRSFHLKTLCSVRHFCVLFGTFTRLPANMSIAFSLIVRMYVSVNYTFEEVITFYRPETLNLILLMFYANISSEVLADKHRCSIFRSM